MNEQVELGQSERLGYSLVSTRSVNRVNREFKRRTDVVGIPGSSDFRVG